MSRVCSLVFAALLAIAAPAWAQVDRATLTGTVKDPSNAVIPQATVKVTGIATGVEHTAVATTDGAYLIVNLAPGEYLVEASATGLQAFAQVVQLRRRASAPASTSHCPSAASARP